MEYVPFSRLLGYEKWQKNTNIVDLALKMETKHETPKPQIHISLSQDTGKENWYMAYDPQ